MYWVDADAAGALIGTACACVELSGAADQIYAVGGSRPDLSGHDFVRYLQAAGRYNAALWEALGPVREQALGPDWESKIQPLRSSVVDDRSGIPCRVPCVI
jgi:hypothetical protein